VTERKKLIEVSIPLDAINAESYRENFIYKGNPSALHKWWAQRPLAACRAVLFAQLVDDPSARPEQFPTEKDQTAERKRLHHLIERLVKWESLSDAGVLEEARAVIRESYEGDAPAIVDPFAGAGSIPLEAQRLGLEARASELNPVAVLICKALVEIPPRWAGQSPVHPGDEDLGNKTWAGAQGLAEDVRYYAQWIHQEAERRIGDLYPKAKLSNGSEAQVIAWIWARTVKCPNPACRAMMPLVRSFWLGKQKGKEAWVRPVIEDKQVRFEIGHGKGGPPIEGTVKRTGAECLICASPVPFDHIRSEGQAGRIRAQLMASVAEGDRRRLYLRPNHEHERAASVPRPDDLPDSELPEQALGFRVQLYGMTHHADLFTNRQLVALTTLTNLVTEARAKVEGHAQIAGLKENEAIAYADAIATYLSFAVSKTADYSCSLAVWYPKESRAKSLFARQAVPMVWDYPEINPLGSVGGSFAASCRIVAESLSGVAMLSPAAVTVRQADATTDSGATGVVCTDPPYYDNIGYADLADFFYVWLRRPLRRIYPDLFGTLLTPKSTELVATPYRFGGSKEEAKRFFEEGFVKAFTSARESHNPAYPMTLFYAFKQSESDLADGIASTGWETMLEALLRTDWSVTATWPIRTERESRAVGLGTNALASSIVLACRPRAETAGVTDRRGFIAALKSELPHELELLRQASIAPVDLPQAAIGPGMAEFSRYAKVIEPSGDAMRVRTALGLINQVLAEVLDEQEGDFDPETRWAIKWFEQNGLDTGPSGDADQLCRAYGTALDALVRCGIVEAHKGRTRLKKRSELPDEWDPVTDNRVPIWEATQHMVKRLDEHNEQAAAELLRRLGGLGDTVQLLAYRLHLISDRRGWSSEAIAYNALGASWSEIQRLAQAEREAATEQAAML
jgi:putative DNA methylase